MASSQQEHCSTKQSSLLPGCADSNGTSLFAKMFATTAGAGNYRSLPAQTSTGDLTVSSLGLGTYLGPETDVADEEYKNAVLRALALGINVLDSAINYRNMRSERAIGLALAEAVSRGVVKRNQVVVCTKGGFLSFDTIRPPNPRGWIEENYVRPGIFAWEDFVAGCHCMKPEYIKNQLDKSRANLGLETIDVYYIHNPETQLGEVSREEFYKRIKAAFTVLEEACNEGKVGIYGIATWNGFRVPPESKGHLSLEELVRAAYEAGGERHHFKILQLPYNMALQEAANSQTQLVQGIKMTLLQAAKELGISVATSASLMQAKLCNSIPAEVLKEFSQGDKALTGAQCALQFVRTTPNVLVALAGMRRVEHVEENAKLIELSAEPSTLHN
ncbi:uncharacterized protein LOC9656308 isoform X2 [Selaginella moellendorffii]|nr:uncharacterized protein LOC9656308 isoform X2 [Selaginella moellendorffii]|eukprot:XP_024541247.1 uncharacterized protein LOC9656308 isoform X2 [Selaginella moellendorffii]